MSETTAHIEIEKGSTHSFGFVFTAVLILVAIVSYFASGTINYWAIGIAVCLALVTLIRPALLGPLNTLWFKFGMLLGAIIAPLVMLLIFFLVITPIGLLMRLFGQDSLRLKRSAKVESYWLERSAEEQKLSNMKNQF